MSQKMDRQEMSYSCLIDNFKVILIFLVVFNHIIAFQLQITLKRNASSATAERLFHF